MALPARPVSSCATITSALGDLQEPLQAAAREPVGGEDAMLERGQRVDVAALGLADAHFGDRRMGERGGHRHQQGKPIDTSFDTSFATPASSAAGGWRQARIGGAELPADSAISAFEPVCRPPRPTDERTQQSRDGYNDQRPYQLRQKPYRFNRSGIVSTKGPCPRPQKVVIGACAPIHPRVGQSGPPGCLIRAGLLCDSAAGVAHTARRDGADNAR